MERASYFLEARRKRKKKRENIENKSGIQIWVRGGEESGILSYIRSIFVYKCQFMQKSCS
jgi:hypothetical protein